MRQIKVKEHDSYWNTWTDTESRFTWMFLKDVPKEEFILNRAEERYFYELEENSAVRSVFSYMLLTRFSDTTACLYSGNALCDKLNLSKPTINRALRTLVEYNILKRVKLIRGPYKRFQYYFTPYEEWYKSDDSDEMDEKLPRRNIRSTKPSFKLEEDSSLQTERNC